MSTQSPSDAPGALHRSVSTRAELRAYGKSLREKCPRESHAAWQPAQDRHDPLHHLKESGKGRLPELLPIRHGRMSRSPFSFFRGAALNMAADLATTPATGLRVQACGDCHLCNFGGFATPERRVVVDINDLDETLPAPWEWDVKRLTASFVVASRYNGHSEGEALDAALACCRSYRERMAEFAEMRVLDVWYSSIDFEEHLETVTDKEARKRGRKRLEKARDHSALEHDFPELVAAIGSDYVIKDDPPLIYHARGHGRDETDETVRLAFAAYRDSLPENRRLLLDRYRLEDIALKVVGVGSVGTVCGVMLLMANEDDPLFLQVKQAQASVLEPYAGKSAYANHGRRVVVGQQLMQSASDLFLGWTEGRLGRHFYVRQLKDMKIKPLVELFGPELMQQYASLCGHILARAHARSGEPAAIAGYLGKSDKFDQAVGGFAVAYADQTERDHEVVMQAVRSGDLEVMLEEP